MAYRRTERINERLAARRADIIQAARDIAAEKGLAAVQIAAVAGDARIAAGTVYRYFPGKGDLLAAVLTDIQESELAAIRAAADQAPGPLSALAAAVVTFATRAIDQPRLIAAAFASSPEFMPTALQSSFRRAMATEFETRVRAATDAGHLGEQDAAKAAAGVLGALAECTIGPLARPAGDALDCRASALAAALFALRGLGIADARARGLLIQVPSTPKSEKCGELP